MKESFSKIFPTYIVININCSKLNQEIKIKANKLQPAAAIKFYMNKIKNTILQSIT